MPLNFRGVEVKSTRYIRPESARELLSKQAVIDPIAVKRIAGYSIRESEKQQNDYMDAAALGIDWGDPAGDRTNAFCMEMNTAQVKQVIALDILKRRLAESSTYCDQEPRYFMDTSALWSEAYKELIKHPVRNWLHATWWMIRQLLRKSDCRNRLRRAAGDRLPALMRQPRKES